MLRTRQPITLTKPMDLPKAKRTVNAVYAVPYLAHAPMEPLNCTVKIGKDACEIWTGTQFQTLDQQVAAKVLGLKPEQVQIHTTFLGGGFGRRATPTSDFVTEAVHVAKAAGAPVKTVWSREDDIRGGYYRPAYVHDAQVGVDADGKPVAWRHGIAGQSILAGSPFEAVMVKNGVDSSATSAFFSTSVGVVITTRSSYISPVSGSTAVLCGAR